MKFGVFCEQDMADSQILFGGFFFVKVGGRGHPEFSQTFWAKNCPPRKILQNSILHLSKDIQCHKIKIKMSKLHIDIRSVLNSDSNTIEESGPPSEICSTAGALVFVVVSGA